MARADKAVGRLDAPKGLRTPVLRLAVRDMASKDFIRAELRSLLEELERDRTPAPAASENADESARG